MLERTEDGKLVPVRDPNAEHVSKEDLQRYDEEEETTKQEQGSKTTSDVYNDYL